MKPDLHRIAEMRIQQALQRGELDDLPRGKQVDLNDLAGLSQEERVEALLARSVGAVPEEVTLLRELAELKERLAQTSDEDERGSLRRLIDDKSLRLSIMLERSGRFLTAREVDLHRKR